MHEDGCAHVGLHADTPMKIFRAPGEGPLIPLRPVPGDSEQTRQGECAGDSVTTNQRLDCKAFHRPHEGSSSSFIFC